jgi:hypothetical protein
MYVNAKMIPVETVPRIREGEMKDSSAAVGIGFKYDIFDTLQELFQMLQCTPLQPNNKK